MAFEKHLDCYSQTFLIYDIDSYAVLIAGTIANENVYIWTFSHRKYTGMWRLASIAHMYSAILPPNNKVFWISYLLWSKVWALPAKPFWRKFMGKTLKTHLKPPLFL